MDVRAGNADTIDLSALAVAVIHSHPKLFSDSHLPNNGEAAGVMIAKRTALFVKTLRDELKALE